MLKLSPLISECSEPSYNIDAMVFVERFQQLGARTLGEIASRLANYSEKETKRT